ncbi:MAG: hypothetical protein HY717_18590 [Planctomycetes bacterium]|nr:hypothetical protein [Planctomycetota bacterium]
MSMWLYQINQKVWSPERFRLEIWEDERWQWPVGRIINADGSPLPGETIVFFYAPSGGKEPGFYGWAVLLEWLEDYKYMLFRPVTPTNHLKMHPWWNSKAMKLAEDIRGKVKQGTLWNIPEKFHKELRIGITSWVSGMSREMKGN